MTLDQLQPGNTALISVVNCDDIALRKHILDMGLTSGTEIAFVKAAPATAAALASSLIICPYSIKW